MAYPADPGGIFASDAHRRVLGHLPTPDGDPTLTEALQLRMNPDQHTDFNEDLEALEAVLADLHGAGLVEGGPSAGWKMKQEGLDALCAPVPGTGTEE